MYWYPRFPGRDLLAVRIGGPGLGNLLFPWARAHVRAAERGGEVIAPTWAQLKLGPLLRGERDLRGYHGLFRAGPHQVSGARRLALLATARRRGEAEGPGPGEIAEVKGTAGLFDPLYGHHALILARLRSMLRAPRGPVACDAIAVHVRLGDFVVGPVRGEPVSATNQRLPVDWYVDAVTAIRAALGAQLGCVVYSDGADEDLAPLLALPATSRARAAGALDDILAIAAARVIVGSNSTFSMWSAYLGQRPSLWYPGARQSRLNADPALEPEYDGGALPARFAEAIRS